MIVTKNNRAACYLRLSREDGDKIESDSISNQRDLIGDYVRAHPEINLVKEYADDGYSGTNFERPEFQKMMAAIQSGEIDCIIVKDLSRLGRNYIETGRYLERVFPFLNVRFISVLDNYDNSDEDDEANRVIIPFKNLLNDSYCRDISMKIQSQFDIKRKNGQFIGSFASYGYMKDPMNKNHLLIDPFAAEVVRLIFQMRIDGYSTLRIANILNDLGFLPPSEYKRNCGLNYDTGYRIKEKSVWYASTVNRVLENEIYTGTMVQGTRRKINYKIKKSRNIEPDKWIRVSETHDAIIDRNTFETVQKLRKIDTRVAPADKCVNLFSGLIICGDCGQNMIRRVAAKGNRVYHYYHCSTYKNGLGCTAHLINAQKLEAIVQETLRMQIAMFLKAEEVLGSIADIPKQHSGVTVLEQQLKELEKEIDRYSKFKTKVYVDYVEENISEEDYQMFTNSFTQKLNAAVAKKKELSEKRERILSRDQSLKPWVSELKQFQNINSLDRSIVLTLIDKIIVYGKDRIEVVLHHADEMESSILYAQQMTGEGRI